MKRLSFSIKAFWPLTVIFVFGWISVTVFGGFLSRHPKMREAVPKSLRRFFSRILILGSADTGARKISTETTGFTMGWSLVLRPLQPRVESIAHFVRRQKYAT